MWKAYLQSHREESSELAPSLFIPQQYFTDHSQSHKDSRSTFATEGMPTTEKVHSTYHHQDNSLFPWGSFSSATDPNGISIHGASVAAPYRQNTVSPNDGEDLVRLSSPLPNDRRESPPRLVDELHRPRNDKLPAPLESKSPVMQSLGTMLRRQCSPLPHHLFDEMERPSALLGSHPGRRVFPTLPEAPQRPQVVDWLLSQLDVPPAPSRHLSTRELSNPVQKQRPEEAVQPQPRHKEDRTLLSAFGTDRLAYKPIETIVEEVLTRNPVHIPERANNVEGGTVESSPLTTHSFIAMGITPPRQEDNVGGSPDLAPVVARPQLQSAFAFDMNIGTLRAQLQDGNSEWGEEEKAEDNATGTESQVRGQALHASGHFPDRATTFTSLDAEDVAALRRGVSSLAAKDRTLRILKKKTSSRLNDYARKDRSMI